MLETIICTISDEGTSWKNTLVREAMENLHGARIPSSKVIGAHLTNGGDLSRVIVDYFPDIRILPWPSGNFVQRMMAGMQSLFVHVKSAVNETIKEKPLSILYMEGDKPGFVSEITATVYPLLEGAADVVVPVRSDEGFSQFPWGQRYWETKANRAAAQVTGRDVDLMYGPRAWNADCAGHFSNCTFHNFGAQTYSVVRAMLERKRVVSHQIQGSPQENYMKKYPPVFRMPCLHFMYRMMQNLPHLQAVALAKREHHLLRGASKCF